MSPAPAPKRHEPKNPINFDLHEGRILLHGDRRRGIWSAEVLLKNHKTKKIAGQLPTSATGHTLLIVALHAALRGTTKKQFEKTVPSRSQKPRLLVRFKDETFGTALQAFLYGDLQQREKTPPLRAGKNFRVGVAKQLSRAEIIFESDPTDTGYSFRNLAEWAKTQIIDPKVVDGIPAVLVPQAVLQVL